MKPRTDRQEERRQRRNRIIISLFIIALMLFSSIAGAIIYFGGDSQSIRYNGHKIRIVADQNGYAQYTTKVDGQTITFYTAPQDSESIALPPGMIETLRNADAIVFLFDPKDNQTAMYDELRFSFSQALPKQQGTAITQADDRYDLQVLSCENAGPTYPFLFFKAGNGSVGMDGNCYTLEGGRNNFALLRDRIVYAYYGISQT
jgi:hypothetical protein